MLDVARREGKKKKMKLNRKLEQTRALHVSFGAKRCFLQRRKRSPENASARIIAKRSQIRRRIRRRKKREERRRENKTREHAAEGENEKGLMRARRVDRHDFHPGVVACERAGNASCISHVYIHTSRTHTRTHTYGRLRRR